MPNKLSVEEIKAVAGAAITARHAADAAKKTYDDSDGEDDSVRNPLKTAYEQAEGAATEAKSKADALSQEHTEDPERKRKVDKLKRKKHFINKELESLGESEEEDLDDVGDEDDLDDPDRPVTVRDLQRIETRKASKTAGEMADAVEDPVARQAIKDGLKSIVPSGNAETDFKKAVAIANSEKNSKVLEELGRRTRPPEHRSGAGAPPRKADAEFVPTAEEAAFMRPPFNLTKEDILKARPAQ